MIHIPHITFCMCILSILTCIGIVQVIMTLSCKLSMFESTCVKMAEFNESHICQVIINQGPHSFSLFELKTFLKTLFMTLTTYCKKNAIFLRKLKDSLMFIMQAI